MNTYTARALNPRTSKIESVEFHPCGNAGYLIEFPDGTVSASNGVLELFTDESYPEVKEPAN
jgi:hypothetical protein